VTIGQRNRRVGSSSCSAQCFVRSYFVEACRYAMVDRGACRTLPPARLERVGRNEEAVLFVVLALLFVPVISQAQGLGSIAGRITDPEGASVPNAKVTAVQVGTGFSRAALSDPEGLYVIPSLQPATYDLSVEANGFSTASNPQSSCSPIKPLPSTSA